MIWLREMKGSIQILVCVASIIFSSASDNLLCDLISGVCPVFGSIQIVDPLASTAEYSDSTQRNESCCVRLDYRFRTIPILPQLPPAVSIIFLNRQVVKACNSPGECWASVPDLAYGFYELRVVVIPAIDTEKAIRLADAAFECSERSVNPGVAGCGVLTMLSQKMNFFEVRIYPVVAHASCTANSTSRK
jgi:hypothetical protein